jgi:hypothetical protein
MSHKITRRHCRTQTLVGKKVYLRVYSYNNPPPRPCQFSNPHKIKQCATIKDIETEENHVFFCGRRKLRSEELQ